MPPFIPFFLLLVVHLTLSSQSHPGGRLPNDAGALLSFKSTADLAGKLHYTRQNLSNYCQWQGVKCRQWRVVRFAVDGYNLRGIFSGDTLTGLDKLRVLILRNNSLFGELPDLSPLSNLRSILLDHNYFSGNFPASILSLYKLRSLDLSFNNFSGEIPAGIVNLNRLNYLKLEFNRFDGFLPPINNSDFGIFNVSGNFLSGRIPATYALSKFPLSSFFLNPNLCGEIVGKPCISDYSMPPISSNTKSFLSPPKKVRKHARGAVVLGFSLGALFLTSSILCVILTARKWRKDDSGEAPVSEATETDAARFRLDFQSKELKEKCKELAEGRRSEKGGNLVFLIGDGEVYTLEQLMKGSAECLGKGTMGATYMAKVNGVEMTVAVKRLDVIRMRGVDGEMFERHMEVVGGLRHQNLVPIRAYFHAKEEKLIVYDYQPNGSIFNLIHGSRLKRTKPLHWTSCLKIAEDVAEGLNYLHRTPNHLVHGNLKSSNILLSQDFEACLTDYCLAPLATSSPYSEYDDVYAFGVLLLELLSGTPQAHHPFLAPHDMALWVKAMRVEDDDDTFEDIQLRMLTEVACLCRLTSSQQRPVIWQVLNMIQKIKAAAN